MAAPKLHLILLAGGRGTRAAAGDTTPKQFRVTSGGPLFAVSLKSFLTSQMWRPVSVTVTVPEGWESFAAETLKGLELPFELAPGGDTRTASTWNAIETLMAAHDPSPDDLVAVHDAARPFASADLMARLCEAAVDGGGAVPGVPVPDTIVRSDGPGAVYLQRHLLRAVQTPQVFRWGIFQAAHAQAAAEGLSFTDDGGLLAHGGHDPAVVEGEAANWKVTTDDDWRRARDLLDT
jgi:2-C-methyl-D-erythritol 4-phosphate cytidylyltransferase/2-C-methyl-D-erythritol 2,4-cyclodiphosphate synthase